MKNHNKTGAIIAIIFSLLGFIIAIYDINVMYGTPEASSMVLWSGLFTLLALILSGVMLKSKNLSIPLLTIICILLAEIVAIYISSLLIIICMVIALIGCIMHICFTISSDKKE